MNSTSALLLTVSLFIGCHEPPKAEVSSVEDTSSDSEDNAGAVFDEGDPATGPIGEWQACSGTFIRTSDSFSWESVEPEPYTCRLSGASTFDDGIVHVYPDDFDSCEFPPWWVEIFDGEPPSFVPSYNDARLALLPTVPNDGARILNLEEELDIENWELIDDEGNESAFRLCFTPDGSFFDGEYITLNESTDFLSYGGIVAQIVQSTEEEHWVTQCAGQCPCGGVVSLESQTDDTVSGRYNGSNCGRHLDGTFTGILAD